MEIEPRSGEEYETEFIDEPPKKARKPPTEAQRKARQLNMKKARAALEAKKARGKMKYKKRKPDHDSDYDVPEFDLKLKPKKSKRRRDESESDDESPRRGGRVDKDVAQLKKMMTHFMKQQTAEKPQPAVINNYPSQPSREMGAGAKEAARAAESDFLRFLAT